MSGEAEFFLIEVMPGVWLRNLSGQVTIEKDGRKEIWFSIVDLTQKKDRAVALAESVAQRALRLAKDSGFPEAALVPCTFEEWVQSGPLIAP